MIDLIPTEEELIEQSELTADEQLRQQYDELIRDKRAEADTPCYEWRDNSCHCHEVPGSLYKDPVHTENNHAGKLWCVAHQSTECKEPHAFITFEQYKRRAS